MTEKAPARPRERRTRRSRLTINQILEKMQGEADAEFNGNLPDNVLGIFNTLSTDDKRTFLRRSLDALWKEQINQAQEGLQEIVLQGEVSPSGSSEAEVRINPVAVVAERESIDASSAVEQQKLRSWLLRLVFVIMVVMFFVILFFTFFYGENDMKTLINALGNINTLLELIFKAEK